MADSFAIDTDALTRAAGRTGGAACELAIALASLRAELGAHAHPWGDDAPGRTFQGRHQCAAGQVEGAIDDLRRAIESSVEGLRAMATAYAAADAAAAIP